MIFTTSVWLLILSVTATGSSHCLLPATALPPHQRPTAERSTSRQRLSLPSHDRKTSCGAWTYRFKWQHDKQDQENHASECPGKRSMVGSHPLVSETTSGSLLCIVSAGLCKLPLYHPKDQFSHGSGENSQQRLFTNTFLKGKPERWVEEQRVNIKSETRHGLQNQRLLMTSIPGNNNIGTHVEQTTFILVLLILFP